MAVSEYHSVKEFDDWYILREEDRDGTLRHHTNAVCADKLWSRFDNYRREMRARVSNFDKLTMLANAEVISPKPDLPNVSSGETAGMIRRMARNLVQHTPNVDVISEFDDDSPAGIFTRQILKSKIIGDDQYSNDMQQNLFASAKNSLTLGFDCVIPALLQDAANGWYVKYDNIYYADVFPEPGVKDVRDATDVFVRRYLTQGELNALIRNNTAGWDIAALKTLGQHGRPPAKQQESVDHETKKHHQVPEGYEIITWYSSSGDPFLTFDERNKMLLRIEVNKHPLKWHPVFFLVMEKDLNQPLGKSQVELILGRQEFQDLMLNGAMKLWYRNINPSIIGYGTVNSIPNLSPGKYNNISNPSARIEAFEVNTQSLLQYGQISTQNAGNMVQLIGAADQQMASQGTGGMMSQTPQGVEAQQAMVDITTNNYQKAIEQFFSRYCSYALTIYFHELKGVKEITPTADTRQQLVAAGLDPTLFSEDGELKMDFSKLATEYWVRAVPGSLVEMEDEKQLRILKEMFVPLSQAMPALAASGDQQAMANASATLQFIVQKVLELSGSAHSTDVKRLLSGAATGEQVQEEQNAAAALEERLGGETLLLGANQDILVDHMAGMQQQINTQADGIKAIMEHLGVSNQQSGSVEPAVAPTTSPSTDLSAEY